MKQLQTFKNDLTQTRIIESTLPSLDEGDISVSIESFAFTANNVTYGVAGNTIGYWNFFQALENVNNAWGCIPVWGFAKVDISKNKDIK